MSLVCVFDKRWSYNYKDSDAYNIRKESDFNIYAFRFHMTCVRELLVQF